MAISQGRNLLCLTLRHFNYFNSKTLTFRRKIFTKLHKSIHVLPLELNATNDRFLYTSRPSLGKDRISLTFVKKDGTELTATAKEGESILDVIEDNFDFASFGVCGGMLSCSTCIVVFKPEDFEKLSEKASFEEIDLLDKSDFLPTSRLGCQVHLNKSMDGMKIILSEAMAVVKDADEN